MFVQTKHSFIPHFPYSSLESFDHKMKVYIFLYILLPMLYICVHMCVMLIEHYKKSLPYSVGKKDEEIKIGHSG